MPEFWVHFNVYCDVKEPGLNSIRCIKFITKSTKSPIIFNPFNSRPWLKKSANTVVVKITKIPSKFLRNVYQFIPATLTVLSRTMRQGP